MLDDNTTSVVNVLTLTLHGDGVHVEILRRQLAFSLVEFLSIVSPSSATVAILAPPT